MKLRKGDMVKVLLGKDRGKEAKIGKVSTKKSQVWVEGVNIYKRHVKKMQGVEGGVIDITKPVNISNLALVCPHCKKVTRVSFKVKGKEKFRICKKCQKEVDIK